MQLSREQKLCALFFGKDFVNLYYILKIFKKKDEPYNWCIFELTLCQKGA